MKEAMTVRLIHAFVVSRITYVSACYRWFAAEK